MTTQSSQLKHRQQVSSFSTNTNKTFILIAVWNYIGKPTKSYNTSNNLQSKPKPRQTMHSSSLKHWPGGRRPWCCCHLRAWPRRARRREGGTTDTSPARAAAMAARRRSLVTPSGYASRGSKYERAMRFSKCTYLWDWRCSAIVR